MRTGTCYRHQPAAQLSTPEKRGAGSKQLDLHGVGLAMARAVVALRITQWKSHGPGRYTGCHGAQIAGGDQLERSLCAAACTPAGRHLWGRINPGRNQGPPQPQEDKKGTAFLPTTWSHTGWALGRLSFE